MFPLNSINIKNPSAEPFVSYINKKFLKQFEPNLFYSRFAEPPVSQEGYQSVTWVKAQRSEITPDQARMSAGITPPDSAQKLDTITVQAKQYGIYTIISDELAAIAKNLNLMSQVSELLSNNMARIVDRVVQDEVLDNAQNRLFAATTSGGARAANRAALTSNHKAFALDIVRSHTLLQEKYVPYREGNCYIAITHSRVAESLKLAGKSHAFCTSCMSSWFCCISCLTTSFVLAFASNSASLSCFCFSISASSNIFMSAGSMSISTS